MDSSPAASYVPDGAPASTAAPHTRTAQPASASPPDAHFVPPTPGPNATRPPSTLPPDAPTSSAARHAVGQGAPPAARQHRRAGSHGGMRGRPAHVCARLGAAADRGLFGVRGPRAARADDEGGDAGVGRPTLAQRRRRSRVVRAWLRRPPPPHAWRVPLGPYAGVDHFVRPANVLDQVSKPQPGSEGLIRLKQRWTIFLERLSRDCNSEPTHPSLSPYSTLPPHILAMRYIPLSVAVAASPTSAPQEDGQDLSSLNSSAFFIPDRPIPLP
ncbi:hypothetical protein PHLGIDRAFT_117832 [Phlebiopsis gigantea 11061_1 CR5-6]|uniref:Uncharacterized protein n=1 Tax=Phlebiopsis gigantea (strain 11061_1 CR5-6) TaxID=745531 RepID=A0A0C3PMC3_PHLG1|nr:hypothetical protein PHLGIDRAFT_117832 [Phlebiopsis gigantea 11061_1 CR5-6]